MNYLPIGMAVVLRSSYTHRKSIQEWQRGRRSAIHHLLIGRPALRKEIARLIRENRKRDRAKGVAA